MDSACEIEEPHAKTVVGGEVVEGEVLGAFVLPRLLARDRLASVKDESRMTAVDADIVFDLIICLYLIIDSNTLYYCFGFV